MTTVKLLRVVWFVVVALMSAFFAFFLKNGEVIASIVSFIAGFVALVAIDLIIRREVSKEEIVLVDERHYALAERSAYLAFRITLIAIAAILWVTGVIPLIAQVYLLPKHYSDALNIGLSLGMGILVIAYYIAYLYYSRFKKTLEGR